MHIVSVYGDNRSGKNYISEELGRRLAGFQVYETSLTIRRFADALHDVGTVGDDEVNKDTYRVLLQQVSKAGHEAFGPNIWVDLSLRDLKEQGAKAVVINGSRVPETLPYIHELGGLNVWVEASREVIAARYLEKGITLTDELYNNFWDTQIRPFKNDPTLMDIVIPNNNNRTETELALEQAVGLIEKHFSLQKNR